MSGSQRNKGKPADTPAHREEARRQLAELRERGWEVTPAPDLFKKPRVSLDDVIKQQRQAMRGEQQPARPPLVPVPPRRGAQSKSLPGPAEERPPRPRIYQPPEPPEILSDDDYDEVVATRPMPRAMSDTARLEDLLSRAVEPPAGRNYAAPRRTLLEQINDHPWLLIPIAAACIVIIMFAFGPEGAMLSRYGLREVAPVMSVVEPPPPAPAVVVPPGEHSVLGIPTVSAEQIDGILAGYGSPATGTGQVWVDLGRQYGIDPAYAVAFFIHESSAGTNPGWAGWKPDGSSTHNVGNIICAGYPTCYGRFRDYGNWAEGINDWYKLISVEYINGRGVHTVEQIIPIYAPSFENNVPAYINAVNTLVYTWRAQGSGQ
jgi:hypothetical protein